MTPPYPRFNPATGRPEVVLAGGVVYELTPYQFAAFIERCSAVLTEALRAADLPKLPGK